MAGQPTSMVDLAAPDWTGFPVPRGPRTCALRRAGPRRRDLHSGAMVARRRGERAIECPRELLVAGRPPDAGSPLHALAHGLLTISHLPERKRARGGLCSTIMCSRIMASRPSISRRRRAVSSAHVPGAAQRIQASFWSGAGGPLTLRVTGDALRVRGGGSCRHPAGCAATPAASALNWDALAAHCRVPGLVSRRQVRHLGALGAAMPARGGDWYGRLMYVQGHPAYDHHITAHYGHPSEPASST